jgi:enamine deaminase RidA (YjgF/YER057c/UK114 family)
MIVLDNPEGVAPPVGAYSQVARVDAGPLLFLSGQIALSDDGVLVGPGDMVAQATRVFELIGALLEAHGATFADVVNVRTFLTDMTMLPLYGQVRRAVFTGPPPTSTTVEVSRLFREGALLEVEVVAAVPAGAS